MMHWLYNLFSPEEQPSIVVPYKVEIKKPRVTPDVKNKIVVDRNINGLTYKQLANKYNIAESTAWRIVKDSKMRTGR